MQAYPATTFTLGTSTVITLPSQLGIAEGIKAKIKKIPKGLIITLDQADIESVVERLAGGINVSSNLSPRQMNQIYDHETYGEK